MKVVRHVDREVFRRWLLEKKIRGASLSDVWGTHHDRPIFAHPVTGQPFVWLGPEPPETEKK